MFPARRACAILGAAASATYIIGCVSRKTLCDAKPSQKWNRNWDFRAPCEKDYNGNKDQSKLPTRLRHIYLVRHGQYENDPNLEDKDADLTKLGREQAELTGVYLKELGLKFDAIVSSTMTRAQQTADIICQHVSGPRGENELLCEGAPCPPDPPHPHWSPSDSEFFRESALIEAAFRKFFYRAPAEQERDTNLLLVCHGNVIRYFICRSLQLQPEAWCRFTLRHGSVTKITIYPDGEICLSVCGETGKMPVDKISA